MAKKAKAKATKKKVTKKATKKKVAKKTTKKKVAKKATTKKAAASKVATGAAYKAGSNPVTKSQITAAIADKYGMTKRQVADVLSTLFDEIVPAELKKHKKINLLSYVKFTEKKKPARKARKGVNPFTGETMMFKAKPASKTVKAVSLKKLKELV